MQEEYVKKRKEKLEDIQKFQEDPYPLSFPKEYSIEEIHKKFFPPKEGVRIKTAGRILSKREMGKAFFFHIEDTHSIIQIYANNKTLSKEEFSILQNLDIGDIIGIEGEPFLTKKGERTLRVYHLKLLAKNLLPLPPLKEKEGKRYADLKDKEIRYRKRYLDLAIHLEVRKDFFLRSRMIFSLRKFLYEKGFIEVETPILQSIPSGASAKPFETWHNVYKEKLYLRIAPELYLKRLLVGGYEKVFEIGKNFRNEGISPRHNPEFSMIEIYQAYVSYKEMMDLTEEIFSYIKEELFPFKSLFSFRGHKIAIPKKWRRVSYTDLIKEKTGINILPFLEEGDSSLEELKKIAQEKGIFLEEASTLAEAIEEIFSQKVEPSLIEPTFVTLYPSILSPLAKPSKENPLLAERFEPYVGGIELGNAFSELNDPFLQKKRFEEQILLKEKGQEEVMPLDEDFIEALMVGMPPAGGLGLGIDRMAMLFLEKENIRDVILFPLLRKKES